MDPRITMKNPVLYATIKGRRYRVVAKKRKPVVRRKRYAVIRRKRKTTKRRKVAGVVTSRGSSPAVSGKTDSGFMGMGLLGLLLLGGVALLLLRKKEPAVPALPSPESVAIPFASAPPVQQHIPTPEQQGKNLYAYWDTLKEKIGI